MRSHFQLDGATCIKYENQSNIYTQDGISHLKYKLCIMELMFSGNKVVG